MTLLSSKEEDAAVRFLRDVSSLAEIPGGIVDHALSYFRKIQKQLGGRKPNFCWRDLAAYALYETLSREGASKTKREIGYFTSCSPTKLFEIESALNLEDTLENAADYVDRFCIQLEMRYSDASAIKNILTSQKSLFNGITAQCGAAAAIHSYCLGKGRKVTLKKICQVCDVSSPNIRKIMTRMCWE